MFCVYQKYFQVEIFSYETLRLHFVKSNQHFRHWANQYTYLVSCVLTCVGMTLKLHITDFSESKIMYKCIEDKPDDKFIYTILYKT